MQARAVKVSCGRPAACKRLWTTMFWNLSIWRLVTSTNTKLQRVSRDTAQRNLTPVFLREGKIWITSPVWGSEGGFLRMSFACECLGFLFGWLSILLLSSVGNSLSLCPHRKIRLIHSILYPVSSPFRHARQTDWILTATCAESQNYYVLKSSSG